MPIFLLLDIHLTANFRVQKCTTQGTIEIRFRILQRSRVTRQKNPMAGWLKELKRHAIKLQRLVARDSLKSVGKLKRNSSTEKKNLCKKMKSDVLADDVGTFQKALSRSLSSLNSKKSKIHSVHLTILVQYAGLIQM